MRGAWGRAPRGESRGAWRPAWRAAILPIAAAVAVAASTLLLTAPAQAIPGGYFVDSSHVSAHPPARWELTGGDFTCSIRREYADSASGHLLGIAEAVCPPRDLLIRIAVEKGYELGADTAGTAVWWGRGIGESRVPHAVTAAAVEHYLELTGLYRERKFREAGTRPLFRSKLVYRASIAHRDTFIVAGAAYRDVQVATLSLVWTYDDGTFVPRVEARRAVVLSSSGDVLAIDGDGAALEKVTISTHRGIGRKEQLLR